MSSPTEDGATMGSEYDHSNEKNLTDKICDLPDPETLQLPRLNTTLCRPEDFDDWLKDVTMKLKELSLDRLIDPTIPPPHRNSEAGKRWFSLSRKVTKWLLKNNTSEDLVDRLNIKENNIILADKFLARAKEVLQTRGSALDALRLKRFRQATNVTDMTVFYNAYFFVLQYQAEFNILREHGIMPSPYISLLDILHGVHITDWFVSASMYTMLDLDLQEFQKTNPTGTFAKLVDYDMFQKYVTTILELLEKDPASTQPAGKRRRTKNV
ncbi:hypothetical protein N7540_007945 [Penicillium herquei]|nr:hypothetical protein N7540_007945 [Penicillium herquei]